jgi:signal transduction histidine kinase
MPAERNLDGLSLEYKLPLLITLLLAGVLIAGSVIAYREVRGTAILNNEQRLARIVDELTDLVEGSRDAWIRRITDVTGDEAFEQVLRDVATADTASVRIALERLVTDPDTSPPLELRDRWGKAVMRTGSLPLAWSGADAESALQIRDTISAAGYSPIFITGGRAWVWLTVPIVRAGDQIGEVAVLRPIGGPGTSRRIRDLVGIAGGIYFANISGGPWVTLRGEAVPAAVPLPLDSAVVFRDESGASHMARAAALSDDPLVIVAETPMSAVLTRPTNFARRMWIGVLLLLVVGAMGAWLISRSISKPLMKLRNASAQIAAGDYTQRVHLARGDELGSLARAFSRMATEVESAQQALGARYDQARDLAARLEAANLRLLEVMGQTEQARTEAETASRAKSDFLATMSHEIRTPINAIVGYTDLLRAGISGRLNADQERHLDRIRTSGIHLMHLVDEVLDLARIESGGLRLRQENADPAEAVDAALAVVMPAAEAKGIALERVDPADPELRYIADSQRVRQILINLLSNAVKFTRQGGRVQVAVRRLEGGGGADPSSPAAISVIDTGVGIPLDQHEAIFEPFVQGERGYTRSHGGVGLGLAISRQLARQMGGDIVLNSEPGVGSTFTLLLPSTVPERIPA